MNPSRVQERGVRFSNFRVATLNGFELRFNKKSRRHPYAGSANIVRNRASYVTGIMYELINSKELARMDRYEYSPIDYRRFIVEVLIDNAPVVAWTYIAQSHVTDDSLKPSRTYLQHLLARQDLLPNDYVCKLEAVDFVEG